MAGNAERLEALKSLRETFPQGSTVYTILRKVSRSGGTCSVTVMGLNVASVRMAPEEDAGAIFAASPSFPHFALALTLGLGSVHTWEGHDVVKLPGFTPQGWIAETLSRALYGDPSALTERAI